MSKLPPEIPIQKNRRTGFIVSTRRLKKWENSGTDRRNRKKMETLVNHTPNESLRQNKRAAFKTVKKRRSGKGIGEKIKFREKNAGAEKPFERNGKHSGAEPTIPESTRCA
ncbi:MAG: hypothetical protein ACLFRG_21140 [Desulfococcaceae bacterium]